MNLATTLSQYANKSFFYVTLDPERALGLEDVLANYTIICPYKSELTEKLKREGVDVVALEEYIAEKELEKIVQRGTYGILHFARDRKIIVKNDYVMVLKNSQLIEDFCKKQSWKLLAPKAKVAEQFENKISQYKLLKNIVPYPDTVISTFAKMYIKQTKILVLQFNRGHSGNSTFFVKSAKDLETLAKKFPNREAKVSEYIKGKTFTLNCLALNNGNILTGSISEQITGLKSATNNPNTTCGNNFTSPRKLKKAQAKKIKDIARNVGKALHKKSYRGLFGIDVIIESGTRKVYFIEVNTHQPASISFEAKLHRKISKVPLLAYFILDSVGAKLRFDKRNLTPLILPISARQIIYRNKTKGTLSRKYIERKHTGKGLISRMKYIKPNEEIFRKQYD